MKTKCRTRSRLWDVVVIAACLFPPAVYAGNKVMAELQFEGNSRVEKTSGVWIDGQYVGYLKELKGGKKVLLLPGEHVISVRQNAYQNFTDRVVLQPGEMRLIHVTMEKAPTGQLPARWATVKIAINPSRAAVFIDGRFVGHAGEFEGVGRGLLVAPGDHQIKIALPGYKTFESNLNPTADQKVELKTELVRIDVPFDDSSLRSEATDGNKHSSSVAAPNPLTASSQR